MVINGLGQKNQPFLPYRDSKLTRLLQGSLTGGSRIIVICNINPSHSNLTQTLSTLKFGVSAGQVKLSIKQNSTSQNQNQSTPQCDKMELSEDHEAELRRMSSKVEDLTMVITRKEEENEGYKAELERSRERVMDLEDTVRGLEEQVGELEKRLKVANSMLENSKVTTAGLK
jgi:chromosome segregation ATPase